MVEKGSFVSGRSERGGGVGGVLKGGRVRKKRIWRREG